jgi:molybdenum cofactor synthesis domain-containing protein
MLKEDISLAEAGAFIDELREKFYFNRETELIDVSDSPGREIAEDIVSGSKSPVFDTATMDGFAVISDDKYPLKIVDAVYAGDDNLSGIKKGEAVKIATGAYLPKGADAVLRVEDSEVKGGMLYGVPLKKGKYVNFAGTDYKEGEKVICKNRRIRPSEIAMMSSVGVSKIRVYKKFSVAVFSNGNEVYDKKLNDTNAPMISAFIKEMCHDPVFIGNVPDDLNEIKQKIREALDYDIIITSGGVSVGERDYITPAISGMGKLLLRRVLIRPGKPLAVGIINNKLIFALPGKPTGAFTAAELLLRRFFMGKTKSPRPEIKCKISNDVVLFKKGFDYIIFVEIKDGRAYPVGFTGSLVDLKSPLYNASVLSSSPRTLLADGYIIAREDLHGGEEVNVNLY